MASAYCSTLPILAKGDRMIGRRSAPWLLAAGLWWPLQAARSQTPRAGVHHVQVVVSASSGAWQETGIIAAAGDLVVVTAEGQVEVTPGEPSPAAARPYVTTFSVDANGIGGSRSNDGTLELEVGTGPIESIGVRGFLFTADSGAVKLRVRARHPDRNAGGFRVGIVHVPSGLIPAASNGKPQGQPRPSSAR
jgi:hypothetical protein